MNKNNFVKEISKESKLSQKDCLNALNAMTSVIASTLKRGEDVTLIGFGKFEVKNRKARNSINPRTREPIVVPAARVPVFRVSKVLKASIR